MRRHLFALPFGVLAAVAACATGEEQPETTVQTSTLDDDDDGVTAPADCDDKDPSVKPGQPEICNGKDDNCDGKIDEGFDGDGDGFPICNTSTKAADCDDKDPGINPGAAEICNNKDDNCNGKVDEGFDKDNDGYYVCARGQTPADCDDEANDVYPGKNEICNGKDDNCDGKIDDMAAVLAGSLGNPVDSHWFVVGAPAGTAATPADGWGRLTSDAAWSAGALWWKAGNLPNGQPATYLFDDFELTATFWINKPGPDTADGMAFVWNPGTAYSIGVNGFGYGVRDLGGYAVVIDTYQNPAEGQGPAPILVVYDDSKKTMPNFGHILEVPLPEVRGNGNHALFVKLTGGNLTVAVDGTTRVPGFAIPGYVPFAGHWGFTASTGGLTAVHAVSGITMRFPNGQGCVP